MREWIKTLPWVRKPWVVLKCGRHSGWSFHSQHDSREEADAEAARNNTWHDAQFSVHLATP